MRQCVEVPVGLDLYSYRPAGNPVSKGRVEIGRQLFFDPLLSRDKTVSCASCHQSGTFADTSRFSRGVFGRYAKRNTPSLLNVAYGESFFWDGRSPSLEDQALRPIQDSMEMDLPLAQLEDRLRNRPEYRASFLREFRREPTAGDVALSIASFLRTLRSGNAAFDRFRAGDTAALSSEARRGFVLFTGKARCATCHTGPTLSDGEFHNTGVAWNGSALGDSGRWRVTQQREDHGAFKTPSLRNVALTPPYMHDGSIASLDSVVAFYDRGGRPNPWRARELLPLDLTSSERLALVAFLRSFTSTPSP